MKYGMTITEVAERFDAQSDDFIVVNATGDTPEEAADECSAMIGHHLRDWISRGVLIPVPAPITDEMKYFAYATILEQGLVILNNHMVCNHINRMDLAKIQGWTPGRVNKLFDPKGKIDEEHLSAAMSRYDLLYTLVDPATQVT
jgi:predicted RNase H-like HicB family nuclease